MTTSKAKPKKGKTPKYDIDVKLTDTDGNAFAVMGAVSKALRKNDVPKEVIDKFQDECMSGDYDHLLQVCMQWVNVS
jgi:hypothetical protein